MEFKNNIQKFSALVLLRCERLTEYKLGRPFMKSYPHDPAQNALAILRIILWFIPGVMLAMTVFVAPEFGIRRSWILPFLLVAFFFIGYFDMLLKLHIEKTNPKPIRYSLLTWALAFASIQIIVAPAVLILIIISYRITLQIMNSI